MILDSGATKIRERTVAEVLDLTFLFLRQNAGAFIRLTLILGTPFIIGLWAIAQLLALAESEYAPFFTTYIGTVVWLTAISCFRLPFVALAGTAMFDKTPSVRAALYTIFRGQPSSPLRYIATRFGSALTVVGLLLKWFTQYCSDEIVILEQLPQDQMPVRLRNFHNPLRLRCRAFFIANTAMGILILLGVYLSWCSFQVLTVTHLDLELSMSLFTELPFIAGLLLSQVYCSVAKFLFYLNLRTAHEGWDLFIAVRRARLTRGIQTVEANR